jgi:hypothetical protein
MKDFLSNAYRCVTSVAAMSILLLIGLPLAILVATVLLCLVAAAAAQWAGRLYARRPVTVIAYVEASPLEIGVGPTGRRSRSGQ